MRGRYRARREEFEKTIRIRAGCRPCGVVNFGGRMEAEELLNHPVLQGMKGDDPHATSWGENRGKGGKSLFKRPQLVVYSDTQCLKDACRGMTRSLPAPGNEFRKFGRCDKRLDLACTHNTGCKVDGAGFVAILPEDPCQFCCGKSVHQIGCGGPVLSHPHIEGALALE